MLNNKNSNHNNAGQAFAISLMQDLVVPTFVLDPDCNVLIWNHACERLTGVPATEVVGTREHWHAFYSEQRMCLADVIAQGRKDELSSLYSYHAEPSEHGFGLKAENWCVMPRLGVRLYLAIDAGPIYAEDGQLIAVVETLRDMTERKLAEMGLMEAKAAAESALHKLEESTQSLRVLSRAIEQSPVMNVITDVNGVIQYVNPKFHEITGYTSDEAIGKTTSILNAEVHTKEFFAELWAKISSGREWHGEMCNKKKNGEIYWESVSISPVRNKKGDITQFIASKEDITERKRNEETLQIIASVFANSHDGILITDSNNNFVDVNPAFTQITGYTRDEVIGKNPRMLSSGRQDKEFYGAIWQTLQQKKAWRGEIWNRRKSGEIYAELLSISAICDDAGSVQRYVGVFSDISYVKTHEAELSQVANYDALTGVPNRRLLADRLEQSIVRAQRSGKILSVCYLDLDGFKQVNDQYGHAAGDQLLVEVTRRLQKVLRAEDTLARLGGDEFVVLLNDLVSEDECLQILDRILAIVATPVLIGKHETVVSASIGVTFYSSGNEDGDTLLRHADQAMYIAKQAGKSRYYLYDSEQN
jgi:diguanylate cyclase (GGDEF)-like protein/PAS domain S-box-containing protein